MASSFFFYDLETTGVNPRSDRVMQFAGQRTGLDLEPIGEPVNIFIKLSPDVLPDPGAIMITGITPQQTLIDGVTEIEFLSFFNKEVVLPGTIFVGFNSIRFDDEFMRFMLYRNFFDPYGWQWQNDCSRWDILDLVRITRALRPEGIVWPFASDGKPTNRLEFLTKVNKLEHSDAHDALSDVYATIAVAKLILSEQPDLFKYLLSKRNKKDIASIVESGEPFVYTSGKYSSSNLHTTVVTQISKKNSKDEALVYDLRYDPTLFMKMTTDELKSAWQYTRDPDAVRLPVKTIKYNRCPAIAPIGVLNVGDTLDRLNIDLSEIEENRVKLRAVHDEFVSKLEEVISSMDNDRELKQSELVVDQTTVDSRLYDGFINSNDKQHMNELHNVTPLEISNFVSSFQDERLNSLLPLYKARNYQKYLSDDERQAWESFIQQKLFSGDANSRIQTYFDKLDELASTKMSKQKEYLIEELQLYGQSLLP